MPETFCYRSGSIGSPIISSDNSDLRRIITAINHLLDTRSAPVLIAIDGGSGSGKSTIAVKVAEQFDAIIIPGDDFYAASIPDTLWDAKTPEARARDCIDWRRLRSEALEPLLAGKPARWQRFDFEAGELPDGTYPMRTDYEVRTPAPVIILDGIYSARPELADLVDLSVLVDVPVAVRHARLAEREDAEFLAAWHRRWDAAEAYYLSHVRPPETFDLIVLND